MQNQGLTQEQINAGLGVSPEGALTYDPGFPIAAFTGAALGLLAGRGIAGAMIGGVIGFVVGRTLQAQRARHDLAA